MKPIFLDNTKLVHFLVEKAFYHLVDLTIAYSENLHSV
jgi:hypothetical protein